MNQDFSTEEVIVERRGSLGVITLNRPKALNALTLDMLRVISGTLKKWEVDAGVQAVLFLGAGDRAFCAGGDIKGFHKAGMDFRRGDTNLKTACVFFAEEYSMDAQIFHYPKPVIAFMDGIVMGGGYGIGGNARYRIVTEKTVFAMPEVGIGFFPDVGAAYHLLKAPQNLGRYLALTGNHIGSGDVLAAQLAEHYVSSVRRDELIDALSASKNIAAVIEKFSEVKPTAVFFKAHGDRIERIFRDDKVKRILKDLGKDGAPFSLETLAALESRSPMSVVITAEHLHRCAGKEFDEVIAEDFVLSQRFMERADFYEGIRAAVIDKDRKPQWNPKDIEAISKADIDAHFAPTGHNLWNVSIFAA